jgi:glycosyltransferase involved in cell wall biosynthesis
MMTAPGSAASHRVSSSGRRDTIAGQAGMTILMVIHQFLPRHLAGSEVYTYHLAQALRARGHRVALFFTEIRPRRPQYELRRGAFDGIPFYEAVHNRGFRSFQQTYRDPEMERLFRTVLDETRPDVVHLQHLYLHSIGYLELARRRGLPVVYTLHEYMLMCLNFGLLLRPGGILCDGPEPGACARCAHALYAAPPRGTRALAARLLPERLHPLAGALLRSFRAARSGAERADGGHETYVDAVRLRLSGIGTELEKVSLFLAPSRFLRQRFVDAGLVPAERIVHSDYGLGGDLVPRAARRPASPLRVGYVGTIAEHKGVHLILEAFRGIREPGIECRIYGDLDAFPDYRDRLLAGGVPPAVRFMGRVPNAGVGEALAELDLLIVPSIWFENSPLTIHEAYLAGIPVLTADRGGMAELVEDGGSGLHFRLGDAGDLRRQLLRALREPGLLERLQRHLPPVKRIEQDAADMEERYRLLLRGRTPAA